MNLYLITQDVNRGYDTFDGLVVAAEHEEAARNTLPNYDSWSEARGVWAFGPEQVKVELIGTALDGTEAGVILGSFNAG